VSVRFEAGARRAIDRALVEAERRGHGRVETLHLFAGLLGHADGPAASALRSLDVSIEALRAATARELRTRRASDGAGVEVAASTDRVLEHAHRLSVARGADAVSDLDVLIACAQDTDSAVGTLLGEAGASPGALLATYDAGHHDALTAARDERSTADAAPLGAREPGRAAPRLLPSTRSGIGYDSHRFAPGGPLVLGGVAIPADWHLAGHSDGDAIAHAVTDAVLGAAAAGDIGEMFSDADPVNRGRDSIEMLVAAVDRVRARGYAVHHVDVTVVAEQPRIAPHREAMRRALARALSVGEDNVSVKGKTNEGMGWIGRGEGIACIAVATLVATLDQH
jgi:2-C-methyl-D-erythritol 2,4-cyclodiphosphate synthase